MKSIFGLYKDLVLGNLSVSLRLLVFNGSKFHKKTCRNNIKVPHNIQLLGPSWGHV